MTMLAGQRGVTLMELLASVLFLSLLAVSLHQLTRALLFGVRVLEAASEAQEAARIGVHLMVRDLRTAGFSPDGRLGNGIRFAGPARVEIANDLNWDGDSDDANEMIGYHFDSVTRSLRRRMGTAPPQPLLSDLAEDGLELSYLDGDGLPVPVPSAALDRIRRIDITLRVAVPHPDPAYSHPLRAAQTASVALRNR
jgi:hypothetical protein